MRIVGLTGGIASGKSTVSNLFKAHGVLVRRRRPCCSLSNNFPEKEPASKVPPGHKDILKKGTGGWKRVVAAFGEDILQANGEVDRPRLGQIVFSDPAKRRLLSRYR